MKVRNAIVKAVSLGKNRVVVGDIRNSTIFCKYEDNRFQIVSEDTMARSVVSLASLTTTPLLVVTNLAMCL